jgi:hypothetical protein
MEALYNTLSLDESDLALWSFVKLLVEKRNNANTYAEGQDILQSALPLLWQTVYRVGKVSMRLYKCGTKGQMLLCLNVLVLLSSLPVLYLLNTKKEHIQRLIYIKIYSLN